MSNKEWVFSGIGAVVVGWMLKQLLSRPEPVTNAVTQSPNITVSPTITQSPTINVQVPSPPTPQSGELAFVKCEIKPVQFNFCTHPPGFEMAECAYVTFGNPPVRNKAGAMIRSIAAKITYADFSRMFTLDGRWADTDQPAILDPWQSTTHLLRVDFNVGDEHHLDIAAKFVDGCFAVNNDSFRGQVKDPSRMLTGPIAKIGIQLVAEGVYQNFDLQLMIGHHLEIYPIAVT